MKTVYVTSMQDFAGKTSVVLGLGRHLQRDGFVVGYMKPLSTQVRETWSLGARRPISLEAVIQDAEFVREVLGLGEALPDIVPIALTPPLVKEAIQNPQGVDAVAKLDAAYAHVAQDKDVLILEGSGHPLKGSLLGLSSPQVTERLDARVIVVLKYDNNLCIDRAAGLHTIYGDRLMGLVINGVTRPNIRFVHQVARPALEERGLPIFAVVPEEHLLSSVSVSELVENLEGDVVCCEDKMEALVEYLMVGAMTAGSALTYFRQRPNKAVITGGDRHDLQLAALETSTRCLILTGDQQPSSVVLQRAQEVEVPIIVVKPDTLTTLRMVEPIFGNTAMHQRRKSEYFQDIFEERFDFARFYAALGLKA
ncbi:MAG: phosphotransacetylase family protein [Anaerolineae bacterium]|nr:phosphotransacetylase family protein [Anaerolineae bacterium]